MIFARALAASILAACLLANGAAGAQAYPDHPITLLVPFAPGGATDAIARIMQNSMEKSLGQPLVIENIGGAGGMIAAAKAARADPDGYTILIHQVGLAAGVSMYPNLTFDAEKDFTAIGLINTAASTLAGRADAAGEQFQRIAALDERARTEHQDRASRRRLLRPFGRRAGRPGTRREGHPGCLSGRGPGAGRSIGGPGGSGAQSTVASGPLVEAGKLKAYAIIGRKRFAGLPDLPTMGELGYKKLDIDFWHMLLAPAGTPRPIINKLNTALRAALADARVDKTFADGGMDLFPRGEETPEAASALLKREIKLWGEVIRDNHIAEQ